MSFIIYVEIYNTNNFFFFTFFSFAEHTGEKHQQDAHISL